MKLQRHIGEIALYAAILATGVLLLSVFDAFELIYHYSREHEEFELDEIILVIPFAFICLAIFALRRTWDLHRSNCELEKANKVLLTTNERVRELTQSKESFMSIACHELRSPLGGAVSALKLVDYSDNEQETRELVNIALEGLDNVRLLIGDVLRFTRLSHGREAVEMAPFSIHGIMNSLAGIVNRTASDKGLVFEFHVDNSVPANIMGSEGGVRLISLNLIGNGIKFTDKGSVSLHCGYHATPRPELVISVSDTGSGIPEDQWDIIFEPYEQGSSDAKRKGLGLGLSTVREFVTLMNGTISVKSEMGKGSTFTVVLPVEWS